MKFGFAGDRDISVWVLDYILSTGMHPEVLFVSDNKIQTHAAKLEALTKKKIKTFVGASFRDQQNIKYLKYLNLDFIIGIHFPYLVPKEILDIPKNGFLNLHPAYLPYNKGWHTPSWAILENTPVGATLHFMSEQLDSGDIIHQKKLKISPGDTADSLYKKLKKLELEIFKETWPKIISGKISSFAQPLNIGTTHTKKELLDTKVQCISLDEAYQASELLKKLRALTTNNVAEAAYFFQNNKKYRVQVSITPEK